jgi:uncharacterized protein with HEPN domain
MRPRSLRLLRDILTTGDLLTDRLTAHTAAEYAADRWLQGAAERQFEVIGEAIRRLERSDPDIASRIPGHRDIVDFRNVLAHQYDDVDPAAVWHSARVEIPPLRAAVAAIIAEASDNVT